MDQPVKNASERFWCSRGMIVTVRGPGDVEISVHVPRPFARIGSDRYAEVCLPQGDLLPCNLYLHATATGIYCLGLSESAPNGWLTPHTRAEIGPYRIKAVFDDEGPAPLAEQDDLRKKRLPPGPTPLLKIRDRGGKRAAVELAIERPLTLVGRRTPSSLRMTHRTVSRVHCVLYWAGDSLWAIDLLSANGTLLGQAPIEAAAWSAGQKLTLGDFRIDYAGVNDQHQSPAFPKLASAETGSSRSRAASRRRRAFKRRGELAASRPPTKPVKKPADANAKPPCDREVTEVDTVQTDAPATFLEKDTPAKTDLVPLTGNLVTKANGVREQLTASEERRVISLSLCSPPSRPAEPPAEFDAPAAAARSDAPLKIGDGGIAAGESAIARLQQKIVVTEAPAATQPAQSDRETTESERQLLEALRMLAACNPDSGAAEGELPPALVQALLAMVQQALLHANRAKLAEAEPAFLPGIEQRLAIGGGLSHPAAQFEQELSLVSLTLVKARQSAETSLVPAAPNVERLIGAIEGLEKHIAQLVQATQDRRAPAENPPQLAAPSPAAHLEGRSPGARAAAPFPSDAVAPPAYAGFKPFDRAEQAERPVCEPPLPAEENQPAFQPASRTTASPPFAPAAPLLDDAMLSRLVSFKTKQEFDIRQRRIFWTATAAVAVFLIIAATGAAKFFLSEPAHEGHASQYSLQEYAKVME